MTNKPIENFTAKELIAFARANGVSVSSLVRKEPISNQFNGLSSVDALDEGLITEGQFAEYHNVNRLEARHLAESMRNPNTKKAQLH